MNAFLQYWRAQLGPLAQPDFITLTAARVFGIALRPLILFLAASHGFKSFSDAFALFITATAASFVVFGNNAHIDLYRSAFNSNKDILQTYLLARKFVKNTVSHVLWFSPAGIALLYLWTQDIWISLVGLFVLYFEKIYDEFQRYYLYKREYVQFTLGFSFRYAAPGLVVLAPLALGRGASLWLFIAAYIAAFAVYASFFERPKLRFYAETYAQSWHGGKALLAYFGEYLRWLYANHLWTFVSANLFLLDRFMVNHSGASIGDYVFFANLFNLAVLVHTLLYFTYRRPNLIRKEARLRAELLRLPNVIMPLAYCCVIIVLAWFLITFETAYSTFSPVLLVGLFIYFYLQAISLVCFEFVFWRVGRGILAAADILLVILSLAGYAIFAPPVEVVPFILGMTLLARIVAYGFLYKFADRFP